MFNLQQQSNKVVIYISISRVCITTTQLGRKQRTHASQHATHCIRAHVGAAKAAHVLTEDNRVREYISLSRQHPLQVSHHHIAACRFVSPPAEQQDLSVTAVLSMPDCVCPSETTALKSAGGGGNCLPFSLIRIYDIMYDITQSDNAVQQAPHSISTAMLDIMMFPAKVKEENPSQVQVQTETNALWDGSSEQGAKER